MQTLFIDNQWEASSSGENIAVHNPSTGVLLQHISRGNAQDVERAVSSSLRAYRQSWSKVAPAERGRLLYKLSQLLRDHQEDIAQLESADCGKPLSQARADAGAITRYFEFYAGACDKFHGETIPYQSDFSVLTWREPHGVTAHIVPWNYPLQIFGRCVAAALAAGNTCIVKPGEDACLSLFRVVELMREAGFPPGVVNLITGYGYEIGNALVGHPGVHHVSFTGSPTVGSLVTQAASINHTPVTLELGGKSPQIVFADADLDEVAPTVVRALIQNTGQTCSAGTRLLVERSVYEPLLQRIATLIAAVRVGPADQDLDCGPLIRKTQLDRVQKYAQMAQTDGLSVVAQASIVNDAPKEGLYFAPIVFRDVPPEHPLAQEEIFGPILVATPFDTEQEALAIANGTNYGLIAGVWTQNGGRQMRFARQLEVGQVYINNYGAGGGVELPFGGVKSSGHGREKGFEAMYSFTTLKTVAIKFKADC